MRISDWSSDVCSSDLKLTTLAGFVLIPFGLFGKSAFMAERVLGNVISSGIKVMVLAVIIGIGSTLFGEFTAGFGGQKPTIDDAMAIVLAARSEEHTSELQSLMRISYAVFCLKKKRQKVGKISQNKHHITTHTDTITE